MKRKTQDPAALRKCLKESLDEINSLAWRIADSDPMVLGSFYTVHKTCSKKNCRCQKGDKHGPFPALSQSIGGKRKLVMVKQEDVPSVREKAAAYKDFQKRLTRLRRLMTTVDTILQDIRSLLLEEYPCKDRSTS